MEVIVPDNASTSGTSHPGTPSLGPGSPSQYFGVACAPGALIPAPAVYDDPFACVTADGCIHVRNYYNFNPKAEFMAPLSVYDPSQVSHSSIYKCLFSL